jgi:hypothetical protein
VHRLACTCMDDRRNLLYGSSDCYRRMRNEGLTGPGEYHGGFLQFGMAFGISRMDHTMHEVWMMGWTLDGSMEHAYLVCLGKDNRS